MALSKQQIEDAAPWKTHFTLWERDLLHLAGEFEGWLDIAVDLGFTLEKIMKPWTFKDAGRRVKVMTWAEYKGNGWCFRCKAEKPIDEFSTDANTHTGLSNECKTCKSVRNFQRVR